MNFLLHQDGKPILFREYNFCYGKSAIMLPKDIVYRIEYLGCPLSGDITILATITAPHRIWHVVAPLSAKNHSEHKEYWNNLYQEVLYAKSKIAGSISDFNLPWVLVTEDK